MYCKYGSLIVLLYFILLILYAFTGLGLHDANKCEQHHVCPPSNLMG